MSEENADKSIVVWYPSFQTPDAKEWTSLCLFHDQVLLPSFAHESVEDLISFIGDAPSSANGAIEEPRLAFLKTVSVLAQERVIRLVSWDEAKPLLLPEGKDKQVHLPKGLLERMENSPELEFPGLLRSMRGIVEHWVDATQAAMSYVISQSYGHPLATNDTALQDSTDKESAERLSDVLAQSTITQLALPDVEAVEVQDILDAREDLKDELLEFRSGILKLTWQLHQQVHKKNDLDEIRHEADFLADTIIKGSLRSLENRMRQHKKKRIRRMLFGTGRVLVEATKLFLPGGFQEKLIGGGKSLLQMATEIDSSKLPEDQIATYLYRLRGKLRTES